MSADWVVVNEDGHALLGWPADERPTFAVAVPGVNVYEDTAEGALRMAKIIREFVGGENVVALPRSLFCLVSPRCSAEDE